MSHSCCFWPRAQIWPTRGYFIPPQYSAAKRVPDGRPLPRPVRSLPQAGREKVQNVRKFWRRWRNCMYRKKRKGYELRRHMSKLARGFAHDEHRPPSVRRGQRVRRHSVPQSDVSAGDDVSLSSAMMSHL